MFSRNALRLSVPTTPLPTSCSRGVQTFAPSRCRCLSSAVMADKSRMEYCVQKLYGEAWNGNIDALDDVLTEDHYQNDVLHPRAASTGRDNLKKGITRVKSEFDFSVQLDNVFYNVEQQTCTVEFTVLKAADEESGEAEVHNCAILRFSDNRVAETRVYRGSLR